MIHALNMLKHEFAISNSVVPDLSRSSACMGWSGAMRIAYIDNTPFVTREKEIAFQILVTRSFIESACGNHIIGFVADILIQNWISIECEEGNRSPTAEHDDAGNIVDTGTLFAVSYCSNGTRTSPDLHWLPRCQYPHQLQPVEIPHEHFAVHGSG